MTGLSNVLSNVGRRGACVKDFLKRSKLLVSVVRNAKWKIHLLKDWWGTRVWTRTSEVMLPPPLGFKLTSGFHPAYALMRAGKFEVEETSVILSMLERTDCFVDIGANLGYYSCLALSRGKPVIAFEPQQQNLQCLFRNLLANRWEDGVEVFPLALSDKPGVLKLFGASGPSASLVRDWAGYSPRYSKMVPVSTLDTVLSGRLEGKCLFIKIDVEGAEYEVLQGAIRTIDRKVKPVWLLEVCLDEFHPDGRNPNFAQIFDLFFDHGYVAYTAAQRPIAVTRADVRAWVLQNKSTVNTFNYLFVDGACAWPNLAAQSSKVISH